MTTGLSPAVVAELDARDFLSLEARAVDRWGWSEELLATLCELVHHLIGVQLARGGVKPGKPLRIPRPGRHMAPPADDRPKPGRVSVRDLAAMTDARVQRATG